MATGGLGVRIQMHVRRDEQLGRLAARLRAAAAGLQEDLTRELRAAAPPVVNVVRATVLAADFPADPPRDGEPPAGLRAGLAAATEAEPLPDGVRFLVHGERLGRWGNRLAVLSDGELAGLWRHRVFGQRGTEVRQRSRPWFFAPIRAQAPRFAAAAERAIDDTVRRIAG